MIDSTAVEERLRRTYADVAARTTLTRRALPEVTEEPNRPSRRTRASLLAGTAAVVCAMVIAGIVVIRPGGRPHTLDVTSTTQAPIPPPIAGLARVVLPGSYSAYVPAIGPVAITPDGNTLYGGSMDGVITSTDLRSGRAHPPIDVGTFPIEAIAITPNGRTAYVVEGGIGDVVVPIDVATGTIGRPIPVPGARGLGNSIAITPDGHTAYVTSLSEVESHPESPGNATETETVPSYVVPIDLVTNTAERPISLEPLPGGGHTVQSDAPICGGKCGFNETIGGIAIAPDGRTAFVSDTAGETNAVFPIDVRTGRVGRPIGDGGWSGPIAITPDGRTAYVGGLGTVTPIDLASGASLPAIRVSPAESFGAMAITPDGRTLVVVRYREVDLVNLRTGAAESPLRNPNGGGAIAIAPP